ncbi:structural toxin protein [Seiridium cupressi]
MSSIARFKLVFFVPPAAVEACKTAIFGAGAGRYPAYTECCWTSSGTGQFRPGDAANPHIGKVGQLEHTDEVRVEALCLGGGCHQEVCPGAKAVGGHAAGHVNEADGLTMLYH